MEVKSRSIRIEIIDPPIPYFSGAFGQPVSKQFLVDPDMVPYAASAEHLKEPFVWKSFQCRELQLQ